MPGEGLPILACACASLRRASRAVTQLYEGHLGSATQFTLLHVLDKHQGMTQRMIGQVLSINSTTLTRTLAPLARRKWIRARRGTDRRERLWEITAAGRREVEKLTPKWERIQQRLRSRLGEERWEPLLHELALVATAARMRTEDGVKRISVKPRRIEV